MITPCNCKFPYDTLLLPLQSNYRGMRKTYQHHSSAVLNHHRAQQSGGTVINVFLPGLDVMLFYWHVCQVAACNYT